jgi:hypothetical protein
MYRYRQHAQVAYGHLNDVLKAWTDLNAIARKHGWPELKVWTPVVGTGNEMVIEADFPDLAAFDKANQETSSDAEWMKTFRGTAQWVVQGSAHDEILQEVKRPLA